MSVWSRIANVLRGDRLNREIDEEFEAHVEEAIEQGRDPEAARRALEVLDVDLVELKRCKSNGLCCGAGGAQMFKEPEKGKKDINVERMEDVLESKAEVVAVGCPFCMTMINDGVKHFEKEQECNSQFG